MTKFKRLTPQAVRYLVVHCAATPPSMDVGAKEIDLWHRAQGYFEIGYHAVIRRDGRVEDGRGLDRIGAHARGWNEHSLGICLVGGVGEFKPEYKGQPRKYWLPGDPEPNFTPEQMKSLRDVLSHWTFLVSHGVQRPEPVQIVGHRDLGRDLPPSHFNRMGTTKACPAFDVQAWIAAGMPTDVSSFA